MEHLLMIAALGVIANWIAWMRGVYTAPGISEPTSIQIRGVALFGVFALYLFCSLLLSQMIAKLFYTSFMAHPVAAMNWIQAFTTSLSLLLLFFFSRAFISRDSLLKIWKDRSYAHAQPVLYDLLLGLLLWLAAFPLVMVIGEVCDLFIYSFFGVENYEQVAVLYLKMTREHPYLLYIALSVILLAAPCIEEFLFRGVLQNFLRQHLGAKAAILLSALGFALFHMAPSQGWGNLSLIISLFTFACFLGFIYEKQRSLFASIALHMAFNAVSAFRILIMVET